MLCHICGEDFLKDTTKVRDHSHLTGEFRGAAHNNCNLKYQESRSIAVVLHNLSGYDSNFLIEELDGAFLGDLSIIASTYQNYISFTKTVANSVQKNVADRDKKKERLKLIKHLET